MSNQIRFKKPTKRRHSLLSVNLLDDSKPAPRIPDPFSDLNFSWAGFNEKQAPVYACKLCNKPITAALNASGACNVSNLRRHFTKDHPAVIADDEEQRKAAEERKQSEQRRLAIVNGQLSVQQPPPVVTQPPFITSLALQCAIEGTPVHAITDRGPLNMYRMAHRASSMDRNLKMPDPRTLSKEQSTLLQTIKNKFHSLLEGKISTAVV
jgi:hypothetical protein